MLCLACLVSMASAQAGKMYVALLPTPSEFYALVTLFEKPCSSSEGNALYLSGTREGRVSAMGCWKLEGKSIKIEWTTGDKVPDTFESLMFKPIADDGTQVSKSSIKVLLTCSAPGWVGDILVERDEAGVLQKLTVAGEEVSFTEKATTINFTFKGKNISLSTSTGVFNFETSGMQSFMNRQIGGRDVSGTGSCKLADATKKF